MGLQLGDLTVKTELSTTNNNSLLETKVSDSDEKEEDNSTASQDDNKGSAELARWREKRVWEKMAASKTWDDTKNAWLSSSLSGKSGADDLKFSPDESLKFSKEKLPKNKTKDDNKVILKGGRAFVPSYNDGLHSEADQGETHCG